MNHPYVRIVLFSLLCVLFAGLFPLAGFLANRFFDIHLNLSGIAFELFLLFCVGNALFIMARFVDKRPLMDFGLSPKGAVPQTLLGFAVGAAIVTIGFGIEYIAGWYRITGRNPDYFPADVWVFTLFVGLVEETVFRGYFWANIERRYGSGAALATATVLFGLIHFANPEDISGGAKALYVLSLFSMGLTLGAAFLVTRNLWLAVGLHWGYDALTYFLDGAGGIGLFKTLPLPKLADTAVVLTVNVVAGMVLLTLARRRNNWRDKENAIPIA